MFLQPQYLQTDLGHSAFEAGVLILPVTAPMIVVSPLGGRLVGLFGVALGCVYAPMSTAAMTATPERSIPRRSRLRSRRRPGCSWASAPSARS